MEVREITSRQEWETFLAKCNQKTFLDSWSWGDVNEKLGRKSWRFGVFETGQILAVALVSKIGAKRGTFLFIPHGPVTVENLPAKDKKEVIELLLSELKKIGEAEGATFIRFSPIWLRNEENEKIFKDFKFRKAPVHMHPEVTWELDITPPEDKILAGMRKTTRYLIRQAEKKPDIQIIKSKDLKDLADFEQVYAKTGQRQKFTVYRNEYIENEFQTLLENNEVLLFLGKYKGQTAVAAMFVFWQNACYYHHSGSLTEFNKYPVSYLLQWEAMKEAKRRGCNIYNFWGIAPDIKEEADVKKSKHPWAGLSLFKMGFGGYKTDYVEAQDFILSKKYWINYIIEYIRKKIRHL